jgi:thioredoxin reductase (NADPH)
VITVAELRSIPLFAGVPDDEASTLASRLGDVRLRAGDWLVHEGEQPSFFLLVEGGLELYKVVHGVERKLDDYGPGAYFGEVPLLLGSPAIASLRAKEPTRVAQLDGNEFRTMFAECHVFRGELLATMTRRVTNLQKLAQTEPPPTARIIGHRYDIACHQLRDFLKRNNILFEWTDLAHEGAPREGDRYPVVVLPGGRKLVTPTLRELAEGMQLPTRARQDVYDVAIIGAGPAGLAAAVYGASEGLTTLMLEREAPGGQAGTSSRIENYLGFPNGLAGGELADRALSQARRFGAELLVARCVETLDVALDEREHAIVLDGGDRVRARTLIVASGVAWRELDVPGADRLVGRGIYYGAAQTEARNCAGEEVFLVGGGNSAGQAAMYFANYANKVTLLVRGPSLADSMSHYLIEQLATKSNIEVCTRCRIVNVEGEHRLESIVVEDRDTGQLQTRPAYAVFAFIGADARTQWLPASIIRDELGFVCTGRDVMDLVAQRQGNWPLARDPFLLETSVPGVFAVGDVRHGSVKRVASGVGEGSMAIAFVHQYLAAIATGALAA